MYHPAFPNRSENSQSAKPLKKTATEFAPTLNSYSPRSDKDLKTYPWFAGVKSPLLPKNAIWTTKKTSFSKSTNQSPVNGSSSNNAWTYGLSIFSAGESHNQDSLDVIKPRTKA